MQSFALKVVVALCAVSMAFADKNRADRADNADVDINGLYTRMGETNLHGGDIGGRPDPKIVDKYEDCIFDCIETPECKAFTWDIERHECYTKRGGWTVQESSSRISGLVKKHLSDLYHRLPGIELNGGGIGGRRDSTIENSADRCALHCMKTPLCRGFTWESRSNECFVKEGGWTEKSNSGRISGTIGKSEEHDEMESKRFRVGVV